MGRKKKYSTDDAKIAAQKRWALEYYYRNKDVINKNLMKKYYESKECRSNNLQDNKSN
jgi:hypothetical protein